MFRDVSNATVELASTLSGVDESKVINVVERNIRNLLRTLPSMYNAGDLPLNEQFLLYVAYVSKDKLIDEQVDSMNQCEMCDVYAYDVQCLNYAGKVSIIEDGDTKIFNMFGHSIPIPSELQNDLFGRGDWINARVTELFNKKYNNKKLSALVDNGFRLSPSEVYIFTKTEFPADHTKISYEIDMKTGCLEIVKSKGESYVKVKEYYTGYFDDFKEFVKRCKRKVIYKYNIEVKLKEDLIEAGYSITHGVNIVTLTSVVHMQCDMNVDVVISSNRVIILIKTLDEREQLREAEVSKFILCSESDKVIEHIKYLIKLAYEEHIKGKESYATLLSKNGWRAVESDKYYYSKDVKQLHVDCMIDLKILSFKTAKIIVTDRDTGKQYKYEHDISNTCGITANTIFLIHDIIDNAVSEIVAESSL